MQLEGNSWGFSEARPGRGCGGLVTVMSNWVRARGQRRAAGRGNTGQPDRARPEAGAWGRGGGTRPWSPGWDVTRALRSDPRPWTCEAGGRPGPCARESPGLGLALLWRS